MSRRNRAEIVSEILDKLKERRFVNRAELSRETLTDPDLFKKIIECLKETGIVKSRYISTPRQREMLEVTPSIEDSELVIKALSKILAPSLSDLFNVWYDRRHPTAELQKTSEELGKEASAKRAFNLVRRSFRSEREKEQL